MKSIELKIKLKTLAAEARIIRSEERKRKGKNWGASGNKYHAHRLAVVRPEARATHLAYGFLKGKAYLEIEGNAKTNPDWRRVENMVKKYGPLSKYKELKGWRTAKYETAA